MLRFLMRLFGRKLVDRAAARHARGGGILDVGFGLALFRDRRVPVRAKLLAVALGALVILLIQPLELPLEAVWAFLVPPVGLLSLVAFNGLEAILGPLVLGALLLRRLTPEPLLRSIRQERYGPAFPST